MNKSLEAQKAQAEKEIRSEERRARNHRLIVHGAILEGVFPAVIGTDGEAVKEFLVDVSHLPGTQELAEKMLETGDEG